MSVISRCDGGVTIVLKVKAGARRTGLRLLPEWLRVDVQAQATDGKANAAVIALLAESLQCSRRQVEILRGEFDSRKVVRVTGVDAEQVQAALERA